MTDTTKRNADLRQMLSERRREMQNEVDTCVRDGRAGQSKDVGDALEHSDASIQGDITFALLQMKAETLARIDEALLRLDAGHYGSCFECAGAIAKRRLRALPFAVRCQACEEARERNGHARQFAQRRSAFTLFADAGSF